jgi:hypothetical protein
MSTKRLAGFVPLLATVALVSVPAVAQAAPHWEKGTTVIGSTHLVVTTKAALAFTIAGVGTIKCTVNDSEEIWNPIGGGAGEDLITAFGPGPCKGKTGLCTSAKYELLPVGLSWPSVLAGSGPVRDEFPMTIKFECNSVVVDEAGGILKPEVGNGQLLFNAGSGTLTDTSSRVVTVAGSDKLKAPPKKIKAT